VNLKSCSALALVCASASSTAQPVEPIPKQASATAAAAAATKPNCCTVSALTPVELEIVDAASSRTSKIGEKLRIRLAEPVVVDGVVIIPAGVEGYVEIIQASKARMMGKAGELTLGMPYVIVGGQRLNLKRLRYGRTSGHSATQEVIFATAAVGLVGLVISGGNVDVQSGAQANAVVVADPFIAPPIQPVQTEGSN